jgi:hypothetical protein
VKIVSLITAAGLSMCAVAQANAARFNLETSWIGDVLHIRVTTDAPDGTSFTAFIADRKTSEWISDSNFNDPDYSSRGYKWAVTVKNGQFVADGFTREGKPFSPGRYMLMLDCGALDRVQIPITIPPRSKEQRKVTTAHVDTSVGCKDVPKEGIAGHLNSDGEYVPNSNETAKNEAQHADAPPVPVQPGETGLLRGSTETVAVCTDQEALEGRNKALSSHDEAGLVELATSGRLMLVQTGTKVKVLALQGFFTPTSEIRVLEGPHAGRRGFVLCSEVIAVK